VETTKVSRGSVTEPNAETKQTTNPQKPEVEPSKDLIVSLEKSEHRVRRLPNGIITGVRLAGVKGARAVHLDIVHVLDLRLARLGKTTLSMQAAVLETMQRETDAVLRDVGLDGMMHERAYWTAAGKISMSVLDHEGKYSLVYETRTAYVVHDGPRPSSDFAWLTEPSRVVPASEFQLSRRSDMRAMSNELSRQIDSEKWSLLERSMSGWYVILAVGASLSGLVGVSLSLASGNSIIVPALAACIGLAFVLLAVHRTRKVVTAFRESVNSETSRLRELGDASRIRNSLHESDSHLKLVCDLNFVISPLAVETAKAVANKDLEAAIRTASGVVDECVRASPGRAEVADTKLGGDEGLAKFLGLFESLGSLTEERAASLALAYVGLSSPGPSGLKEETLMGHLTALNFALYEVGLLRPDAKDQIDDLLNMRALEVAVQSTAVEPDEMDGVSEPDVEKWTRETAEDQLDAPIPGQQASSSVSDETAPGGERHDGES